MSLGPGSAENIGEGVGHFMQTNVLPIGVIVELPDEMCPGKMDAIFADVPLEWCIIQAVAIFVLDNKYGPEIVEQKVIQSKGQLYGRGAHQEGHALIRLNFNVFEVLYLHKEEYPANESFAAGVVQAFKIGVIAGKEGFDIVVPLFIDPDDLLFFRPHLYAGAAARARSQKVKSRTGWQWTGASARKIVFFPVSAMRGRDCWVAGCF